MAKKKKTKFTFFGKKTQDSQALPLINLLYISVGISVLNLLIILIAQRFLPPVVPLYYGLAEGEQQLGTLNELFILPVLSFGVIIANYVLASFINNEFIKQALVIIALSTSLLLLITSVKIIFLVGSI
jgi:hypothetical protein